MSTPDEILDLLFGRDVVYKASPDGADLSSPGVSAKKREKRERTQARVGLATNIIGLGAGVAAIPPAVRAVGEAKETKRKIKVEAAGGKYIPKGNHKSAIRTDIGNMKPFKGYRKLKGKHAVGIAAAGLGLQLTNVAGDTIANRVLARESKLEPATLKGGNTMLAHEAKKKVHDQFTKSAGSFRPLSSDEQADWFSKRLEQEAEPDIVWEGEFSKVDSEKRQVFGWASVVRKDGQDIVDLQGDYISIDEVEKAGYEYVIKSRKGGNQHARSGEQPLHVSDMIESFIVTPEKIEKMGLPETMPLGWWVGYQINDDATWDQVKDKKRAGFSIHGKGNRV
jgi:hypothetical protein